MTYVNPGIFREYDIRGVADQDFTSEALEFLAMGLAAYFQSKNIRQLLVGRDCRTHSPRIRQSMIEFFLRFGFNVTDIGMCTSPLFYFAGKKLGIDGGIMITASHNPPQDNGMKVACGPSTIYGEEIQMVGRLAQQAETGTLQLIAPEHPGQLTIVDLASVYTNELTERICLGKRKLHVVVDCGNGSAGAVTKAFMQATVILHSRRSSLNRMALFPITNRTRPKQKICNFCRRKCWRSMRIWASLLMVMGIAWEWLITLVMCSMEIR